MLGNVDRTAPPPPSESSAKDIAAGIAAELRSELTTLGGDKGSADKAQLKVEELEKYLKNLEASLTSQLRAQRIDARPSTRFESVLEMISELTPTAHSLLRSISNAHLTQSEYKRLSAGRFGPSLLELRKAGLLVPVVHTTNQGLEPCYYFPSGISKIARAAFHVLPEPPKEVQREVDRELKSIGYPSRHDEQPTEQS